ncbi:hypothetical protein [Sphingomonas sp. G-3-2-10]|uniref:hypothetical protein n=1 Tax=Sphingomonas sp. G-3-2-10 TaxID=2728838 RepID=UPI00146D9C82|nr:hypothetical protein [Sphingomonas sp. G-3-2-10]NML05060.1 hypothetical protein [Sphingomonas sp. G-3-2-10]
MIEALLLSYRNARASVGIAAMLMALPSSAFSTPQEAKTTPEAFAEALVARDTALMAVIANGGMEDGDQLRPISATELVSRVDGCRVGKISARTISLDCAAEPVGGPAGKCFTGNYTILFLFSDSLPTAASLSKTRLRTPECNLTPPPPAPTGSQ